MSSSITPKNLLVTGGSGFIGSAFIRYLFENNLPFKKIVNVDLLTYAANPKLLESVEKDSRYLFYQVDICNQKKIEEICLKHEIDTIVHFAAETHVDNSIETPQVFIRTNIGGTFSLLEVMRKHPLIYFHHISTDEVYGSLGASGTFDEDSPYQPNSPYSASKASSDHLVRSYIHTYKIQATISHCTNNYGPGQNEEKLLPTMIKNAIENKPLPIYGRGKNVRDWLYVDDHVAAIWQILTEGKKGEVYNISSGYEKNNIDLIYMLLKRLSHFLSLPDNHFYKQIAFIKDRPGHDFRYSLCNKKIQSELGWKPLWDIQTGLDQTLQWYVRLPYPVNGVGFI